MRADPRSYYDSDDYKFPETFKKNVEIAYSCARQGFYKQAVDFSNRAVRLEEGKSFEEALNFLRLARKDYEYLAKMHPLVKVALSTELVINGESREQFDDKLIARRIKQIDDKITEINQKIEAEKLVASILESQFYSSSEILPTLPISFPPFSPAMESKARVGSAPDKSSAYLDPQEPDYRSSSLQTLLNCHLSSVPGKTNVDSTSIASSSCHTPVASKRKLPSVPVFPANKPRVSQRLFAPVPVIPSQSTASPPVVPPQSRPTPIPNPVLSSNNSTLLARATLSAVFSTQSVPLQTLK